nr:integrase, catalytic region, zinc finger, CCHC-type, peptidase aspartic, catalytic [Tanacetum cinerariifolium]
MANISEDIQCVGFDTRPPMLDRTDFASWQQRIRLYYWGKENGVNILKSIDEGPFQMGTVRNQATVQDGRVVVQNVQGRQNRGQGTNPWGGGAAGYGGVQNRVRNANPAQENGVALDEEQLLFLAGGQDTPIDEDAPMAQTIFMANLSSADPVNDEAGPSYDSNILSEYVKDNVVPFVHSNVSSIPNDAYMMIYNDMYEPHA